MTNKPSPSEAAVLNAVPGIPADTGGPVFDQPWQAEVFAMTLQLHEQGIFEWSEWAEVLAAQIKLAQQQGDDDLGDTYYLHWLAALEQMVVNKDIGDRSLLGQLYAEWDTAARNTPHGQPILIKN